MKKTARRSATNGALRLIDAAGSTKAAAAAQKEKPELQTATPRSAQQPKRETNVRTVAASSCLTSLFDVAHCACAVALSSSCVWRRRALLPRGSCSFRVAFRNAANAMDSTLKTPLIPNEYTKSAPTPFGVVTRARARAPLVFFGRLGAAASGAGAGRQRHFLPSAGQSLACVCGDAASASARAFASPLTAGSVNSAVDTTAPVPLLQGIMSPVSFEQAMLRVEAATKVGRRAFVLQVVVSERRRARRRRARL